MNLERDDSVKWVIPDGDNYARYMRGCPVWNGRVCIQPELVSFVQFYNTITGRRLKTAVDVGSNIGALAYYFGNIFNHVWCFEPNPITYKASLLNLAVLKNITMNNLAIGDHIGTTKLRVFPGCHGSNFVDPNENISMEYNAARFGGKLPEYLTKHYFEEVEIRTLDSYNIVDVDLIKVDVEGFEYSVIMGAEETIRKNKPTVVVEYHEPLHRKYFGDKKTPMSLLEDMGMAHINTLGRDYVWGWK